MVIKKLILGVILCLPGFVFAQGPGWTEISEVFRIVTTNNGGIDVRLTPELQGCASQSGYGVRYASLYPDHPGIDRIYSLLLAAQASGQKVRIYLVDSTCKIGEAVLGGSY